MLGWQQYGPGQCLWKNDQPEYHEILIHRYRMLYVMRCTDGKTGAIGKRERLIVKLLKYIGSSPLEMRQLIDSKRQHQKV